MKDEAVAKRACSLPHVDSCELISSVLVRILLPAFPCLGLNFVTRLLVPILHALKLCVNMPGAIRIG